MWALESRRGLGIEWRTRDRPCDGERVTVIAVERDRGLVDVYGTRITHAGNDPLPPLQTERLSPAEIAFDDA